MKQEEYGEKIKVAINKMYDDGLFNVFNDGKKVIRNNQMRDQNEEYIKMIGDALLKQTEKEIKPYDPKEHDKVMAQIRMARMLGVEIDLGR